jgi:endonuclease YncB( thermonuclease family)
VATTWTVPATVVHVVDGDTVKLRLDLGWNIYLETNCRIDGIDTPELNTAAGKKARDWARGQLPPGAAVTYVSRQLDKYGRPLGQLLYGRPVRDYAAAAMVAGHAREYHGGAKTPHLEDA